MNLSKLAVILFVSGMASGCQLNPPDVEVCVTLGSRAGFCAMTLSDLERLIPIKEWHDQQVGRFSLSPEAFGEYQKFIERACELTKCSKKEERQRKRLLRKMERLDYIRRIN